MKDKDATISKSCRFFLGDASVTGAPIYFFCRVNGVQIKRSLGVRIETRCWDPYSQQAIIKKSYNEKTRTNNLMVNSVIGDYKDAYKSFCTYVETEKVKPEKLVSTLSKFLYLMESKQCRKPVKPVEDQLDLITRIKRYVRDRKVISFSTKVNYGRAIKAFGAFLDARKPKITSFSQIDTELFIEMGRWMLNNYTRHNGGGLYQVATLNDFLKFNCSLVRAAAVDLGELKYEEAQRISYISLKNKASDDDIALTDEEVMMLYHHKCDNEDDELIKDVFVLECVTGQRISDTVKLDDCIEQVNGVYIVKLLSKKTSELIVFDLIFDVALKILQKYDFTVPSLGKDDHATKDKINHNIKQIARDAGISGQELKVYHYAGYDKPTTVKVDRWKCVTSHTGRRTFVTALALRGWTYEKIGKYTGQRNPKTVMHYDKSKGNPAMMAQFNATDPQFRLQMIGSAVNMNHGYMVSPYSQPGLGTIPPQPVMPPQPQVLPFQQFYGPQVAPMACPPNGVPQTTWKQQAIEVKAVEAQDVDDTKPKQLNSGGKGMIDLIRFVDEKLNNFMNPMSIVSEAKSFIATNTIDMSWCYPTQGGMTFGFYRPKLQRLFPENSAEIEQILTMLIA